MRSKFKTGTFVLVALLVLALSVSIAMANSITVDSVNVCLADGSVPFTSNVSLNGNNLNVLGGNLTGVDWINPTGASGDTINNTVKIEGNLDLYNDNPADGNRVTIQFWNGTDDDSLRIGTLSCHTNKSNQNFSECTFYGINKTGSSVGVWDVRYSHGTRPNGDPNPIFHLRQAMSMGGKEIYEVDWIGRESDNVRFDFFDGGIVQLKQGNFSMDNQNMFDIGELCDSTNTTCLKFFANSLQMKAGNFDGNSFNITGFDTADFTTVNASQLNFGTANEVTIASGATTITGSYHKVDTESDASTDDLDTINGGQEGDLLVLRTVTGSRDVTLKDGTGNLKLAGDFTLDVGADRIMLMYDGSDWIELSRSNNA